MKFLMVSRIGQFIVKTIEVGEKYETSVTGGSNSHLIISKNEEEAILTHEETSLRLKRSTTFVNEIVKRRDAPSR